MMDPLLLTGAAEPATRLLGKVNACQLQRGIATTAPPASGEEMGLLTAQLWHEPPIARKAKRGPDSSQVAGDSIVPARPGRRVFREDILWVQHVLQDESIRATGRAERSGATSRSRTKVGCRQKGQHARGICAHSSLPSRVFSGDGAEQPRSWRARARRCWRWRLPSKP